MTKKTIWHIFAWLLGLLILGIVVTGYTDTATFGLVSEDAPLMIFGVISYPITALACFLIHGRMCRGEEGMIALITIPITIIIIGILVALFFKKSKK